MFSGSCGARLKISTLIRSQRGHIGEHCFCGSRAIYHQHAHAVLNLRIDPGLKEAVRIAAKQDHRSIANLIELLIRRHCEKEGIPIPEQLEMFGAKDE